MRRTATNNGRQQKRPGKKWRQGIRLPLVTATVIGLAAAEQVTVRTWMHERPPRAAIDGAIIAALFSLRRRYFVKGLTAAAVTG